MPPKRANPIDFPPPASSSEAEDDTSGGSSGDEDGSSSEEEQTLAPSSLPKTQTLTPKSAIPQSSDTKKPTEDSDSGSDSESEDDPKVGSGSEDGDSDSDSNEEEEEPLPVTPPPPKKATTSKKRKASNEADETPTPAPAPAPVASKKVAENGEKSDDGRKNFQRVWSDADEVAVLEGIIEYKASKGKDAAADINAFRDFIKSRLHFDVSLSQLRDKISKLKKKFKDHYQMDENKTFPSEQNQKLFDLSKVIWGAGAGASNGNAAKSNSKAAEKSQKKTEKSTAKEEKSNAKASQAEKSNAKASQAEKSNAKASLAEKSNAKASQAEKSNAKASQAEKSNAKASQAEKSNAKASQAEKSNAKASQAEKSKAESGKKKAEAVTTDEDEDVVMGESNGVMKMGINEGRSAGSNKRMKYNFVDFSTCNEEDFVTKGLAFLDDEKRSVIEKKWKKFQVEELKLAAKKHALLKEKAEMLVAALED